MCLYHSTVMEGCVQSCTRYHTTEQVTETLKNKKNCICLEELVVFVQYVDCGLNFVYLLN